MYKGRILDIKAEGLNELPVAVIKQEDLDLIFGFVFLNHPYEINGRGYVRQVGNVFNIEDIFILPQKTSIGSVNEDEDAIHKYIAKNIHSDLDFEQMNFQWHSHPAEVYFSSKDQESAKRWGGTMDFVLSLVVNKRSEYICRLDIFRPAELSIQIPLIITHKISEETMQFCRSEIAEKVTIRQVERLRKIVGGSQKLPISNVVVVPLDDMAIQG